MNLPTPSTIASIVYQANEKGEIDIFKPATIYPTPIDEDVTTRLVKGLPINAWSLIPSSGLPPPSGAHRLLAIIDDKITLRDLAISTNTAGWGVFAFSASRNNKNMLGGSGMLELGGHWLTLEQDARPYKYLAVGSLIVLNIGRLVGTVRYALERWQVFFAVVRLATPSELVETLIKEELP